MTQSHLRIIRQNLLVAASYWACGCVVALFFKAFGVFPAPNWPSASVALAAALIGGRRLWPGIFIGSFLANATLFDASVWVAVGVSVTNTLAPVTGAWLIRRFCRTTQPFFLFRDVVAFILFGVALHGLISATGGVTVSYLGGVVPASALPSAWLRWCLSDGGGALFFGPALLLWLHDRTVRLSRRQALELAAVSLATLLLAAANFFLLRASHHALSGVPYLLAAPLLWITVRFSPRAGTTLFSAVAVVATIGTVAGLGPFNLAGADRPLVTLGLMVVSLSISVLAIGSLTEERRAVMRELERRVAARTAELVRANRAKDEFLATISHEMRTPLTALLGNAQLLLGASLTPPQRELAERMGDSGELLLSLINDLLDLSRIEAGGLELNLRPVALREVVTRTAHMFEAAAARKGLALHYALHDVPEWVRADGQRLQQILINLVGNAVKFTTQGAIALEVTPLNGDAETAYLRFEVRDSGVGIAERDMARLFQPFSQVDASAARHYGGSGLGLAICKRLVEAMGGQIDVESVPGRGSTFWFVLPLRLAQPGEAAPAGTVRPPPLAILLVEDVPESARVVAALLRREGHTVTVAEDGAAAVAAVAAVRQAPFDLVLMDLQMPGMDGIEATRRIRALPDPALAGIVIFALTANLMRDSVARCLAAGMEDVVAKPLRSEQLNAKLVARFGGETAEAAAGVTQAESPGMRLDLDTLTRYRAMIGTDALLSVTALYRGNSLASMEAMAQAMARGDLATVARIAHKLSGSSLTLGIRRLGDLAAALEAAALACDAARVAALHDEIAGQLPATLEALMQWCDAAA